MFDFLVDLPNSETKANFIFAHGAGAPMDSPFMTTIAKGLAEKSICVVRFEFPYMATRRVSEKRPGPGRAEKLIPDFQKIIHTQSSHLPLFIGGKSMGGRIASMLADEEKIKGIICLGFPFHPPGKPTALRTSHLEGIGVRTLIVQGERDIFGSKAEVENYRLSKMIQLKWIPDGDHSFKPRKSSGFSEIDNLQLAISNIVEFVFRDN